MPLENAQRANEDYSQVTYLKKKLTINHYNQKQISWKAFSENIQLNVKIFHWNGGGVSIGEKEDKCKTSDNKKNISLKDELIILWNSILTP